MPARENDVETMVAHEITSMAGTEARRRKKAKIPMGDLVWVVSINSLYRNSVNSTSKPYTKYIGKALIP